jgi:hypothetical protein
MTYIIQLLEPKAQKFLEELANLKHIRFLDPPKQAENPETYPFHPNIIQFDNLIYVLRQKLNCEVSYENNHYFIENEFLELSVWGDTRDAAEQAFAFSFHALYTNFAQENDSKLSKTAKVLKNNLLKIVKDIYETKKS